MCKKCKLTIITIFVLILALIVTIVVLFQPRPIVKAGEKYRIDFIMYNPNVGTIIDDCEHLEDFDAQAVFDCLSRYEEHLTLSKAGGYSLCDVEFSIMVWTPGKSKNILLGNINRSDTGYGTYYYAIENAESLKEELREILITD